MTAGSAGSLLARLALQNLGRREARTLLLIAAVAVCTAAIFTGSVVMGSIKASMNVGFTRLGADMLVVPAGALTNITAALLTAEPTDLTLDQDFLSRLDAIRGVEKAAPQLVFRTDASGYGGRGDVIDVIAFDPARDFTVQPWLEQRLGRPIRKGDIIVGGPSCYCLGGRSPSTASWARLASARTSVLCS
jgi:putative ABC transport system permease protein